MREAGRAPLSLNLLRSLSYEGHELRRTGFVTGWRARRSSLAYQKEPYFAWFSINFFLLGIMELRRAYFAVNVSIEIHHLK